MGSIEIGLGISNCQSGTYKPYNNPTYIADRANATLLQKAMFLFQNIVKECKV
uniref:Uncharacterized protein n=1 Tax=Rhizophora mucronata TaxID=61149 RepID=A0A2P2M3V7_RHIMU